MAINQLKAGAILSYVTIGLSNVVGLLYTPFLLRMLGQSEFGLYSIVASVVGYLTILDLGFGNAIIRYTAKFRAEGKIKEQYSMFGMFVVLYSVLAIITLIGGVVLYLNIDSFFGKTMTAGEIDRARIMMILLVFNIAVSFPLGVFGAIISAYEIFIIQRVINIVRIIIQPCIMIPLLFLGQKAIAMVVVMTLLNMFSLLINCYYCLKKIKIKIYFNKFDWSFLKEISGYSFFIFLNAIFDRIYWSTGQFVLGIVAGTSVVAIYAIGLQMQSYFASLSGAIMGVFLPKVTGMVARKDSEKEISDLFIKVGRVQYLIVAFAFTGFLIFGRKFILTWAGQDYKDSYLISLALIAPLIVPLIQNLGIVILQARNQQKFRTYLYLSLAIISLFVSIPFAKKYGGIGYAIASTSILAIGNILLINIYYYKKVRLDIPRFWKEIGKMSIPVVIMLVSGYMFDHWVVYFDSLAEYISKMIIYALIYIILIWKLGMNNFERNLFTQPLMRFGIFRQIKERGDKK